MLTDVPRVRDVEKLGSDSESTELHRQRRGSQFLKTSPILPLPRLEQKKYTGGGDPLQIPQRDLHRSTSELLCPAPRFLQSLYGFSFTSTAFKIRTVFSHVNSNPVWDYCKAQF